MKSTTILLIGLLLLNTCSAPQFFPGKRELANDPEAFDEVYGTSAGQRVRLVYEGIIEHYEALSDDEKAQFCLLYTSDAADES